VAEELLKQSPEDTVAHALLGVMKVETATTEADYREVRYHLNKARQDHSQHATADYGLGQLALRLNKPQEAVTVLREAYQHAPDSDPICYALAQAERQAGNTATAEKLLQEYQKRRDEKQKELDLLNAIADAPNDKARYDAAIAFYTKRGLTGQANAIRQALQERFKKA
jgi:predicted Zn-dependent protease